jgi:hypothetical protein
MMQVKAHQAAAAVMIVMTVMILTVLYWLLWPYEPFRFAGPLIVPQRVRAGTYLSYALSYCKPDRFKDDNADVQISYVNHLVFTTPITRSSVEAGCATQVYWVPLPELPMGTYHLEMIREYQVNPIRRIRLFTRSNDFEVYE